MTENLRQGFRLGEFRVHPPSGTINGPGGTHHVPPSAMDVLVYLAENPGELVSREQIVEHVWSGARSGDNALSHCITDLRHQLDDHADNPRYIQTLPRRGFRLLAQVAALEESEERASESTSSPDIAQEGSGYMAFIKELQRRRVIRVGLVYLVAAWVIIQVAESTLPALLVPDWAVTLVVILVVFGFPLALILAWAYQVEAEGSQHSATSVNIVVDKNRKADFVIIAALTGVVLIMGYELYVKKPSTMGQVSVESPSPTAESPKTLLTDRPSIAVLPFDNLTGNPADQDISDGIVEELLIKLSRITELRVVGRKASFYYRDNTKDWQTIAEKLGASMIIHGSIRRNNTVMRIAAQLISGAGFHLWGDTYDAPTNKSLDMLAVQRSIADQVVEALPIQLSDESKIALQRVPTTNDRAYELYLQGRSYLRQLEDIEKAESLFLEALEIDPAFVGALSGLCEAQLKLFERRQQPDEYTNATSNCTKLTAADSLNAEAYVALGTLNRLSGNHAEAMTLFERALDISPYYEPAFYGMARSTENLGQYDDAEQYYHRSVEVDPGYWLIYIGYGGYLERGGRTADAIEQYQQAIRLAPTIVDGYTNLGSTYFGDDQWDKAADVWRKGASIKPDAIGYLNLGTVEYYLGNFDAASDYFRSGINLWPEFYPLWGKMGAAHKRLDQMPESRAAFENAAAYATAVTKVDSKDSRPMYYLASYLAHLGRFDEAREWSARAVEISPDDSAAHYFAAIVASLAGDDDVAVDALAEALRLGYSTRIIQQDTYFQPYLNSAKLAVWLSGTD